MSKSSNNQKALRKRVYAFLDLHPKKIKTFIVNHFRMENVPKLTMYDILQRKENNIGPERKVGSGQTSKKMSKKQIKRREKLIDKKDGVSQHILAKRFNVSQQYTFKIINDKTSIRHRKKTEAPKRTSAQKVAACPKCRKLVALFRKKIVIIDDKSYLSFKQHQSFCKAGYYTSNLDAKPNEFRLKRKSKYEPKLLAWVALSEKGVSKHYIAPSSQAFDKEVYISKCLVKLKKFINEVQKNDEIVFWPDIASAHYSS